MKMKRLIPGVLLTVAFVCVLAFGLFGASSKATEEETGQVKVHPSATQYQAQEASLTGGARKETRYFGYTGSGYVEGYMNNANAKTTFNVTVETAGDYYIALRYSAGQVSNLPEDRTVGLTVNNDSNAMELITVKGTESWNTWDEYIHKVKFNAGSNTISIHNVTKSDDKSDCINLDKLSVWKSVANPVTDALAFNQSHYKITVDATIDLTAYEIDGNGTVVEQAANVTFTSSDPSIAKIEGTNVLKGVSAGTATIMAKSEDGYEGKMEVTVINRPTLTADCSQIQREVDGRMFGYILTPNYDVPDSRMTLLGPILDRETIPVQNFQAIGDLDGSYYAYEYNIKERFMSAYERIRANGLTLYMMLGMSPSWAAPSGGPVDSWENKHVKTPTQLANFKQYIKDFLQYIRDNGAEIDFADLTNEYWTGTQETYRVVWEALREVYPEYIPAVGPGAVGYSGAPDFYIGYAAKNDITVEGPSWHEFWDGDTFSTYSQLKGWYDGVAKLQQKPENKKVNGKYIIWEENNSHSAHTADWTRSMSNVVRTGVDFNIKGCIETTNWNGMSDLLTTKDKKKNSAYRRPLWWVYYMFSQMSGNYVEATTNDLETKNNKKNETFTGVVSLDENEAKVVVANCDADSSVLVSLKNLPFDLEDVTIDLYKITKTENNGLEYQSSIQPSSTSGTDLEFEIGNAKANETWMAVIKTSAAKPDFFAQMTPDDGEVVTKQPTFTWTKSRGADSYTLTVSKNKDLSNPILVKEELVAEAYTPTEAEALTVGDTYYWSVTATNGNGSRPVSHDVKYSMLVGNSDEVPGQFGPYLPSVGTKNEDVVPELKWSTAYNADSYRLIISKNKDFTDVVLDKKDIKSVRSTGQFGPNSQGYYKLTAAERLSYKTTYYWKVYAVNENGERPMNGVLHYFTTKAEGSKTGDFKLIYPDNSYININGRAVLEWEESDNAFFYHLEISDKPDMSNIVLERTHMIYNKYRLEQNALEPGKTYYWRVTALTKNRTSSNKTECSNGICSFTMEKFPGSPLLYAEQPGDNPGTVDLWFHTSNQADSYNIYYGKEEGKYTKKISNVKNNAYTVSGLKGGQEYYFAITAVNSDGESKVWNERSVAATGDGTGWNESMEEGVTISAAKSEIGTYAPYEYGTPPDTPGPTPTSNPPEPSASAPAPITPAPTASVNPPAPTAKPTSSPSVKAPGKVTVTVKSPKKRVLKITWKKNGSKGYQIMVAKDVKMKKGKKTYNVSSKVSSKTIKKLKSKTRFYVKIRGYRKSGTKKIYGKWSKVKNVKIK